MAQTAPTKLLSTPASQLLEHHLSAETQDLMKQAVEEMKDGFLEEPEITVYGKKCHQPRDIQFRSDESKGYFYSGQCAEAQPMTPACALLLDAANKICATAMGPASFNAILINRYKNGKKNVGAHSDAEHGLDKRAGVFAMSYGASRKFRIRKKQGKGIAGDFPARHGYALQMKGEFQKEFTHEIPKEAKVEEERISFTFRKHDLAIEATLWEEYQVKKAVEIQRQDGARVAAEIAERNKRKREDEETAMWGELDEAKAMAAADEQKEAAVAAGAGPSDAPPPSLPPSPAGEEEDEPPKNIFGGPLHPAVFEEWDPEVDGPEPSGCMAAGWGHRSLSSYQSSPKRTKREESGNEGRVYGSTGGAGHGHGGPGL